MDRDRLEGKGKSMKGKAQEAWGKMTGDTGDQVKGKAKQVEGKTQETFGKGKDEVRAARDADRERGQI